MRASFRAVVVALLAASGCQEAERDPCPLFAVTDADRVRCAGNEFQVCVHEGPQHPGTRSYWTTREVCAPPQVCRIGTIPGILPTWQAGCFAGDASCTPAFEGRTTCVSHDTLMTCTRRPSDQVLLWTATSCGQDDPLTTCYGAACVEFVEGCPRSSWNSEGCDGDFKSFCKGTPVDGKWVFAWEHRFDCSAFGQTCGYDAKGLPQCVGR